jgi:transcription initiation factor TFIIIB Brf1 subunit/transcription initiation factor TFIIB
MRIASHIIVCDYCGSDVVVWVEKGKVRCVSCGFVGLPKHEKFDPKYNPPKRNRKTGITG